MASLLAITDIGSGWVGCGPRAWACLYNCHIQSCGSWPPRLNQSSIWAVESTWSSCLPFGNTVDRLALGDLAPLTVDRGIDRLIQRRDQQRRHVRAARAARVARLTFLNAPLHQPLRVDQSEPPFRIVGRGEAGPWRPLRCGAAAAAGNMAVAADNALDLIRRHARLVHRVTAGQDVNGFAKVIGLLQLPRAPVARPPHHPASCAIDGRKEDPGGCRASAAGPRLRHRQRHAASPPTRFAASAQAAIGHSKTSAIAPPMRSPQRPATPYFSPHLAFRGRSLQPHRHLPGAACGDVTAPLAS